MDSGRHEAAGVIDGLDTIFERTPTLDDRILIADLCIRSSAFRAACIEKCQEGTTEAIIWFINAFLFTQDSRVEEGDPDSPFILWKIQEQWIEKLQEAAGFTAYSSAYSVLCEKSRDLGFSYTTLAWILYHWLFTSGFKALLGSRKEAYVDNGLETSLFGKIDYFLNKLPGWLLPRGYSRKQHRRNMKLINPVNGAVLEGEATNAAFGRGGRFRVILFDEAAYWDEPAPFETAWGTCSSSTRCRIALSTPHRERPQNFFYQLRNKLAELGRVFTAPWHAHPDRDEEWLAEMIMTETEATVRYEILLSYEISSEGLVYGTWKDVPKGIYEYPEKPEEWGLYVSWDFGFRDLTLIWWGVHHKTGRVRMLDSYQGHNKDLEWYVPLVTGVIPAKWPHKYGREEMYKIVEHHGWGQPIHYGDPAGNQKSQTDGKSPFDLLAEHGIYLRSNPRANSFADRKRFTEIGLRRLEVNIDKCSLVDAAMNNYHYKPTRNGNEPSGPEHDWSSHAATAVEFFFVCEARFSDSRASSLPKPTRNKRSKDHLIRHR